MLKGKKVLIIDDDPYTRDTVSLILELYGHKTLEAADGLQALQIIENQFVDLIILDIQMPRLNGMAILDELKNRRIMLPTIVITGYGRPELLAELKQKGYTRVLLKPFSEADILEKIEDAVNAYAD